MTSNPHPLALPSAFSPDDLDALTELSLILTKVRAGIQASNGLNASAGPGSSGQPQQLSFKEVPGATDSLKHKLQRAKAQTAALPDMDRTIAEQEEEIQELHVKIEKQKVLLAMLKETGNKFAKDEDAHRGERMDTS